MSFSYSSRGDECSGGLPHAAGFRDLIVYRKARLLQKTIFEISKEFPKPETYSLTDQIRRSSRSVGAQIAEAWAKRRYEAHFISKLTDALGENFETEHWLETTAECGYATGEKVGELLPLLHEVGRMLSSMIEKAAKFCGMPADRLRESSPNELSEFFAAPTSH